VHVPALLAVLLLLLLLLRVQVSQALMMTAAT
jgi:hypothetical protein